MIARHGHRRHLLLILGVVALSWPRGAAAYRPFDSTDAAVAAPAEMEVEVGPVGYLRLGSQNDLVAPMIVLNWGFAPRWELVVQGRGVLALGPDAPAPRYSVDEGGVFLKAVLREGCLQDREGPSIATEFGALLPTLNGPSGGMGAQATLIVSQRWPALTVHVNAEIAWTPDQALGGFGGIILEGPDAWPVRPVGEVFVEGQGGAAVTVSGLVGAIWRVSGSLSLDAALRVATTGGVGEVEVRAGFTWAFPVGFP